MKILSLDLRNSPRLRVLAYHGIENEEIFARQLDHLVNTTYPMSLEEVLRALSARRSLPEGATLITFDDGDRSLVDKGLPLLLSRGLPAVSFVVAGSLDSDRPLWWQEVEELHRNGAKVPNWPLMSAAELIRRLKRLDDTERLATIDALRASSPCTPFGRPQLARTDLRKLEAAGISIGNHSLTHPCLDRCSDEKILFEVEEAHKILCDILGHEPLAFAYPNGDHDPRVRDAVGARGYRIAFLFDHRRADWPPTDPLRVSRLRVGTETPFWKFRLILSGVHPAIHHALGRP